MNISLPTHDVTLDGKQFRLVALPYAHGMSVLAKLMNLVGPALSKLEGSDLGAASIIPAVSELFVRANANDIKYLTDAFFASTEVEREHGYVRLPKIGPAATEELFAANHGLVFALLIEHIKLNFQSFLAVVPGINRPG